MPDEVSQVNNMNTGLVHGENERAAAPEAEQGPASSRRPPGMRLPPVLFEDSCIVAFDKPAGMLVTPDRWDKNAEFLMQIIHTKMDPGIFNVHRLDRETSGVLLCAKNDQTLRTLCRDFEQRRMSKRYLCLARGCPPWQEYTVDIGILPDRDRPGRMRASKAGKRAETRFRVLEMWLGYSFIEAVPITGRTHQIRVHLASAGYPIVADPLYGNGRGIFLSEMKKKYKFKETPERPLIGRVALHSECLSFTHPETGQQMTIQSPVPHDFNVAMKYLSRFAARNAASSSLNLESELPDGL